MSWPLETVDTLFSKLCASINKSWPAEINAPPSPPVSKVASSLALKASSRAIRKSANSGEMII